MVELNQGFVCDNEMRRGVACALSTHSAACGQRVFHNLDHLRFRFTFAKPFGFEFEGVGSVLKGLIGFAIDHLIHRLIQIFSIDLLLALAAYTKTRHQLSFQRTPPAEAGGAWWEW
jgi:hypothetical protein